MLVVADSLFDDFKNKTEILGAINVLQLSARTATRRIELIARNLEARLAYDVETCEFFSIQLDESTDAVDTTQLAISVRMVFDDFSTKEFLKILPLTQHVPKERTYFHCSKKNENTEFKDLLLHTEVRWLTRGKVLERFINLLPQVKEFVASRNEVYEELENKNWLLDLGFLVDMTMKFNELNLKLQGKNSHITDMISAVNSFKCKLELLKAHLLKNSLSHFQNVKRIIENLNLSVDEFDTTSYIKTIDTLIIEFSSRFQDFLPLKSAIPFFVNPFNVHEPDLPPKISNYFDVINMQDLEIENN
ncbi:general transcription factor II-I repeat domain-containing protein 2 [Trichonephila clavipes]|nr:general transcription factor II-I repeat domain-containing protein 2 [Trichonephila clavipes]